MTDRTEIAIVTGGSSGLGAATASALVRAGYGVFNCDIRSPSAANADATGRHIECDVGDDRALACAFDEAVSAGSLRVAVACAGRLASALVYDQDERRTHPVGLFADLVNANLLGAFNTLRHATRCMCERNVSPGEERGVIILTGSIAADDGQIGQIAYSATKAAIAAMALPAARELSRYGIRVVAIAPGMFETPMVDGLPSHAIRSLERQIVYPARLGEAGEFASLVKEIIRNRYLNGATLRLDAGTRLGP